MTRLYAVLLLLILSFGTALSILWFNLGIGDEDLVLALKDLALFFGVFLVLALRLARVGPYDLRPTSADIMLLILISVNVVSFAISPAGLSLRVLNLRRDLSLFLTFWIFYNIKPSRKTFALISWCSFGILAVTGAFGMLEYFMPDYFWDSIVNIPGYWRSVVIDPFATSSIKDSGRFYSADFVPLLGHGLRRMVSFYAEPTTLAAFFVSLFCWSYLGKSWRMRLGIFILGILTLSKYFVLAVLVAIIIRHFADRLSQRFILYSYSVCILLSFVVMAYGVQSGALNHIRGLLSIYQLVSHKAVMGFGLGAAGNYAINYSEENSIGAESGLGNVVAQMGIGGFAYLWVFSRIYRKLWRGWHDTRQDEYLVGIMMLLTWVISFFLSASSLGLSGNAFVFIYIGCVLGMSHGRNEEGCDCNIGLRRGVPVVR